MRVLHILEATTGGTRRHILDLLPALQARGIGCDLVYSTLRNPQFAADAACLAGLGIGVHEVPMQRGWGGLSDAAALRALQAHLRAHHYDAIHCHSSKAGLLGRLMQPVARRIPVVYTPHCIAFDTALPRPQRRAARLVEQVLSYRTDHFIAVSHHELRMMRAARLCSAANSTTIHNAVDLRAFDAIASDSPLTTHHSPLTTKALTIGCFGRLTRQKNQASLLRAFAHLRDAMPGVRLLLIGGGEDEATLRAMAQRICISKLVTWVGEVAEARPYYAQCDIIAQPSRWEGCPYSILEAMSAARPVIATAVGGVPELIPPLKAGVEPVGLAYRSAAPGDLAEGLITLAADASLRERIGTAARQRVADQFRLEQMVDKTVRVYESVAG